MSTTEAPSRHRAERPARTDRAADRDGVVRWLLRIGAWTLILACVGMLTVAVLVPRVAGATPYSILTGSMRPTMPPGTLVVVRPTDPDAIGIGTVVTYQLRSGEPEVVTHRVIAVRTTLSGEREYRTQGDANPIPDADWVRPEQVRGSLWYAVPYLGRVNLLLSGHERQLLTWGVGGLLVLYAGSMFVGAGRDRRPGAHA